MRKNSHPARIFQSLWRIIRQWNGGRQEEAIGNDKLHKKPCLLFLHPCWDENACMERGGDVLYVLHRGFIRAFTSCLLSAPRRSRSRLVIAKSLSCRLSGSGSGHNLTQTTFSLWPNWILFNVQFSLPFRRFRTFSCYCFVRKDLEGKDGPVAVARQRQKVSFIIKNQVSEFSSTISGGLSIFENLGTSNKLAVAWESEHKFW